MQEVVIYSKPNCCLCDEAKQVLKRVQNLYPFSLKEINILEDEGLFEKFKWEIPVISIDDRKVFKFSVDEKKLIELLKKTYFPREHS